MNWIAHVSLKLNNNWDWSQIKKSPEVDEVWSTQGDWDAMVKLKPNIDNDNLEKLISNWRTKNWVSQSHTWWAKEIVS